MPNTLEPQQPRVGICWHRHREQGFPAMLWNTGSEIEMVVCFDEDDELHRRFIGHTVRWGDDPDYSLHAYELPDEVWFADAHGHICLVGPYERSASLFGTPAEGRVYFRYAVFGGNRGVSYSSIHRLRTRLDGLEDWIPLGSIRHRRVSVADETFDELTLRRREPVRFDRALNATVEPTYDFTVAESPGRSQVDDKVHLLTHVRRPRSWIDHLSRHLSMRELLMISGWRKHDIWQMEASHDADPVRFISGDVAHPRWAPVLAPSITKLRTASGGRKSFLIEYDDIGAAGLRRWSKLQARFHRGIDGMLNSIEFPGAVLESSVADAGSALEWIGHRIADERGSVPGRWLQGHLERVSAQITANPGFDLRDWGSRFASLYNDVKHPDRPDPGGLTLANGLREARLVFRFWVGTRLGMDDSRLERNLGLDPMRTPYSRM